MNITQLAAAGTVNLGPLASGITYFLVFVDSFLVPLIFAFGFLAFLWGVYTYFIAGGADEEKRKKGKEFVMYSIIGFVLMVSLWGIVNILTNTLGFSGYSRPALPLFGSSSSSGTTSTATDTALDCQARGGTWNASASTCSAATPATSQSCPDGSTASICTGGRHLQCTTTGGGQCVF